MSALARIGISLAGAVERDEVYRIRHAVYALELGQHPTNDAGMLCDGLDAVNEYIVARREGRIVGFVSVTSPQAGRYSVDKYIAPEALPVRRDEGLYEVRLLTVVPELRQSWLATLLMYAALRYVESRGGKRIVAIGREEILPLYAKVGLAPLGRRIECGKVAFELMAAEVQELRRHADQMAVFDRVESQISWELGFPFRPAAAGCFHGGAFFDAIGPDFQNLVRREDVVNADVLDAWFEPSPNVIAAIADALPWIVRTSPPADCGGFLKTVARVRGVAVSSLVPGAGSSDLIFRALRLWLARGSRVALLDPTYGEYAHVLTQVIGCQLHRIRLSRADGYEVHESELEAAIAGGCEWIILVNPNSPTGQHVPRRTLQAWLRRIPGHVRVWIDETYVDYVSADKSLEWFAAESKNVVVCKSMSKAYALSGMRVGYLCGPQDLIAQVRAITPPWVIGLAAQIAAVAALNDREYYARRYAQTHALREELADDLGRMGMDVLRGVANFVLVHLPQGAPDAATVVAACRRRNVFVRDVSTMGTGLGDRAIRIAVKSQADHARIVAALSTAIANPRKSEPSHPRCSLVRH